MSTKIDLTPAIIESISLYAGDASGFIVSFVDDTDDSNPIDVSHLTWTSQIRQTRDSDVWFDVDLDTTDAVNGNVTVNFTSDLTRNLPRQSVWDLQYIPEGNTDAVTYLQCNKVKCSQDVTRSS